MSLQSLSLVLGAIGTSVAVGNQLYAFLEKRRAGRVDEHRLDLEGLQTLVREQREELDDARTQRREDHERIENLEAELAQLRREQAAENERHAAEVRELGRKLRRAENALDDLRIAREMRGKP